MPSPKFTFQPPLHSLINVQCPQRVMAAMPIDACTLELTFFFFRALPSTSPSGLTWSGSTRVPDYTEHLRTIVAIYALWLDRSCYLQQVEPQIQRSKKPAGAATLPLKQRASVPSGSEARVKDSLTLENSRQKKLKEIAKDAGNTATKTAKRTAGTSTLGQCRRD